MFGKRKKILVSFCIVLFASFIGQKISAQDANLQAVGALGSANLYLTYISIGSVADGHSRELYSDEFAASVLTSITEISGNSVNSLAQLLDTGGLDEEDTAYVKKTIDTLEVLIDQAESYKTYMEKKGPQYAEIYNNYKQIAWQQVAELLGFEQQTPNPENGK
jgi:hypothetical protein